MGSYLHYVPVFVSLIIPLTIISSYIWSVSLHHIYPVLPSVSATGTLPPESCLFSMMLNLVAFTMLFIVYVRHKEVVTVFRAKDIVSEVDFAPVFNTVATAVGYVSTVSLSILANFQLTNIRILHEIGVVICVWSFTLYVIQQTVITFWITPEINGFALVVVRGLLGAVAVLFLVVNAVVENVADAEFASPGLNYTDYMHWNPSNPGWEVHVSASVTEYIIVLDMAIFILTFYWDFRKIRLSPPEIEMKSAPIPEPAQVTSIKHFPRKY